MYFVNPPKIIDEVEKSIFVKHPDDHPTLGQYLKLLSKAITKTARYHGKVESQKNI